MCLVRVILRVANISPFGCMAMRLAALTAALFYAAISPCDAKEGGWDLETYHINVSIAIDAPGGIAEQLATDLPEYIRDRIEASLIPAWSCDITLANRAERANVFANVDSPSDLPPPKLPADRDKLLLATVRWKPDGVELVAREFDAFVQRWSPPIRRESHQREALPEQLFALICQTFSPLAQFEPDTKDPKLVLLKPRGASLPRSVGAPPLAKPGDVYSPILRRTGRGGQLEKNGLQVVPWTYVEVSQIKQNVVTGKLQSASRKPFPTRRQGRTDQVAIALRADPSTTTLHFRSR